MSKRVFVPFISLFGLSLSLIFLIHQIVVYNTIWEWSDALHHELAIVVGLTLFIVGLLVGRKPLRGVNVK